MKPRPAFRRTRYVTGYPIALLVTVATIASAQGLDTSSIVGHVIDPSGSPVKEVTVSVSSTALIAGPRRAITTDTGDYRFVSLAPGVYQIDVSAAGFEPIHRTDVYLPAGMTLVADVDLRLATLAQSVNVAGTMPVIDVKTSESRFRLEPSLVANLPTDRVLSNVMNFMPGVNHSLALGGVQKSNALYVDGLNTADAGGLGPWASFNYNWIDAVEVVGIGAGAQYGEFSGIIQRAQLKSGSNMFHGLSEYRTTRPSWVGANTSSLTSRTESLIDFASPPLRILDWSDAGAQFGGPMVRDRLWYFAGFQDFENDAKPALVTGPGSTDEHDRRVLTKIDAAATGSARVSAFYEYDRYHLSGDGLDPLDPIETTTTDKQPTHNWNGRIGFTPGSRTVVELGISASVGMLSFDPRSPATRSGPYPHMDILSGTGSGNSSYYDDFASRRETLAGSLIRYGDRSFAGAHKLMLGFEREWSSDTSVSGIPGGRRYLDQGATPFQVVIQPEFRQELEARRATIYGQDDWTIGECVTLQPGLRASFDRGLVSQMTVLSTNAVSPRLGVAWDVARDHKTVVRAHYGRYHEALLTSQFAAGDHSNTAPQILAQVTGPDQFLELSRTTPLNKALDPNIAQPHFDQWTVGVEREIWPLWSGVVQYIGRRYGDLDGYVDRGAIYEPVVRQDPGPDGKLGTPDDGGLVTLFNKTNPGQDVYYFTNPPGIYRRYNTVQFIVRRENSRNWQMQSSYAWSRTRGNADNGLNSNSGGPDLGTNGVAADPNRAINADGPATFDFTHEIKLLGTWRAPFWGGVNLSGVYQYHTGLAWGRTAEFAGLPFVTFGVRVEPRGTRRTDALNDLDARVEKTLGVSGARQVGIFVDVFNVGNQGAPDVSRRLAIMAQSGPSFGQPQYWLAPRTVRAGVRFQF